jgi:hypothetical protein
MKKSWLLLLNAAICLLLPQGLFLGCSLIGLAIGSAADASLDDIRPSFRSLALGTPITVLVGQNTEVSGRYVGVRDKLPDLYRQEYESALRSLKTDTPLPLPGDSLTVILTDTRKTSIRGQLLGVDPGLLLLNADPHGGPTRLPIETILEITTDQRGRTHLPTLVDCIRGGLLPYRTETVLLMGGTDTTRIPFSSVAKIKEYSAGSGKWTFFTVGLIVDVALVAVLIGEANAKHESCDKSIW